MIHRLQDFLHKLPSSIVISKEKYEDLLNDDGIYIPSIDSDEEDFISYQLLISLLDDEKKYQKTVKFMESNDDKLYIGYFDKGKIQGLKLKRKDIVLSLRYALETGDIEASDKHLEQLSQLERLIGFDKLVKDYGDQFYSVDIEGTTYRVPIHNILNLVTLSDEGLRVFCTNPSVTKIQGITKDKLLYATKSFFTMPEIIMVYYLSDEVKRRLKSISDSEYYDIQAMNQLLETRNFPFPEKEINPDLEKAIIDGMPEDFTTLQKALYIYIKMCSLLSYDPEFFAVNQKGPISEKHKDPNTLDIISPTNNKVVCYEFNWIYGKMLDKLGIHFRSISSGRRHQDSTYGDGHSRLNFRVDKYLVSADAVVSILNNDLTNVKTKRPISGLVCLNHNLNTKEEFYTQLNDIYFLVLEQQKEIGTTPTPSFIDIVNEYQETTDNIRDISIQDRLEIWSEKAKDISLSEMDYYGYLVQLRRIFFSPDMLKHNFGFTVVRDNSMYVDTGHFGLQGIVAKNDYSFENKPDATEYYYLNNGELISVDKERVTSDFSSKSLEYLEGTDEIPGIHFHKGGIKK